MVTNCHVSDRVTQAVPEVLPEAPMHTVPEMLLETSPPIRTTCEPYTDPSPMHSHHLPRGKIRPRGSYINLKPYINHHPSHSEVRSCESHSRCCSQIPTHQHVPSIGCTHKGDPNSGISALLPSSYCLRCFEVVT